MMTELTVSSFDTILKRTGMILSGTCTPGEYHRMVQEKAEAAHASLSALTTGSMDLGALLAPWHSRATANARRLRRR
jgi:hypothetical protein